MSGRFVRASKFRHVHGVNVKKEKAFMNIRGSCTGEGNYIAANGRYWAVPFAGGGGPVLIGRQDKPGRVEHNAPKLNVHKTAVLDLAFSPFQDHVLATVGEEGSLKVTALPDDGAYDKIQEANVSLDGHTKKLAFVRWHPNSQGIIATSAFDNLVKIWDVEGGREVLNNEEHPDLPQSIEWNENGSLLASSCKDRFMRIFDPRQKTAAQKTVGIDGGKSWRVCWMDNRAKIGAVGFSKSNARCVGVWDPRKFDTPLNNQDIDTSASVMIPWYDTDTSVLYIAGKGDACIRYYELTDEDPFLFFLADFRDTESTKGACFLPKTFCDTKNCEIAVCYRLMKEFIQPVPFVVPRKSDLFQADLYPDTYAGVPATTANEFMGGVSRPVVKRGMKPGSAVPTSAIAAPSYAAVSASSGAGAMAGAAASGSPAAGASASASASGSGGSMSPEGLALQAALAKIAELEAKIAKLEAK